MNEVELGEYGSVVFLVNDRRLEKVLEKTFHVLQKAITQEVGEDKDLLLKVLDIYKPFWRLVYYEDRPKNMKPKIYFTILGIGNIILDVSDQDMLLALEGIVQPVVEAYRKRTEKVALDILDSMQKEASGLIRNAKARAKYI